MATTAKTEHEWSQSAYLAKAEVYAEAMTEALTDWQGGLWSTFLLEMLVRAAVAGVSPALVADNSDWNNILYALGNSPKKAKFVPRTAAITELIARTEELIPEFTREHANFCATHFARRNAELHSGNFSFDDPKASSWLPNFYAVCDVLVRPCNSSLEALFGPTGAKEARDDIAALTDEAAKTVLGTINAHKVVWEQKPEADKKTAVEQAATSSLRHAGHRVTCPSCSSVALVQGKPTGESKKSIDEEGIFERQSMKPEDFFCVACGLRISGYSRLLAAGLGESYTSTKHYDAVEYFEIDVNELARGMWEDDNNEY